MDSYISQGSVPGKPPGTKHAPCSPQRQVSLCAGSQHPDVRRPGVSSPDVMPDNEAKKPLAGRFSLGRLFWSWIW